MQHTLKSISKIRSKLILFFLTALRIQLFITLVALPILVYWGLTVSILTIAGNIIFAPLLTIFLLLASLIFFLEILHFPNYYVIYLLEQLSCLWLKISPINPKQFWLFFPQTTWLLFLLALGIAIFILTYIKLSKNRQIVILAIILVSTSFIAKLNPWIKTDQLSLKYRHAQMKIAYNYQDRTLTIHDYGILKHKHGIENWLCYQLTPALIKNFGTIKVKNLYLKYASPNYAHNLELVKQALIIEDIKLS
jgi:hypothetical protein